MKHQDNKIKEELRDFLYKELLPKELRTDVWMYASGAIFKM